MSCGTVRPVLRALKDAAIVPEGIRPPCRNLILASTVKQLPHWLRQRSPENAILSAVPGAYRHRPVEDHIIRVCPIYSRDNDWCSGRAPSPSQLERPATTAAVAAAGECRRSVPTGV